MHSNINLRSSYRKISNFENVNPTLCSITRTITIQHGLLSTNDSKPSFLMCDMKSIIPK